MSSAMTSVVAPQQGKTLCRFAFVSPVMCRFQTPVKLAVYLPSGSKKLHTAFIAITLSALNKFSQFLAHTGYSIGNLQLDDA